MRAFSTLVLLVATCLCSAVTIRAETPPNVVLIISDDHHWGDYSFMGHPEVKTPHMDKLASQSLLFTRGYVPSSLCCPSLATIISGQFPHQNYITSNDPPGSSDQKLKQNDPVFIEGREKFNKHMDQLNTLPRVLGKQGYLSFQTGKWWQGNFARGGFTHGMTKGSRHGDDGLKIGRETMQPMYDFMKMAKDEKKPFFLWYAPFLPHTPHNPPDRLLAKYKDKAPSPTIAKYWAMVEWLDETCGDLMKHLDEQGLAENTIVIYVADNGWIQDPEKPKYAPRSKQSQYDGGLRTPIMVRWPAKLKPSKSQALASSIDIAPTVLRAAGIEAPKEMTGLNLLDTAAVDARKTIYGEIFTHDSQNIDVPAASLRWRWMIDGDYKIIVPDSKNEPDAKVELYKITTDINEERDLSLTQTERVKELTAKLDAWWKP
ncbi:sulfatase [Roseimicrobium sp. ORNL1]|uniref:sulfatase family protein n=1 Tax=Roseimicrobium sp. ORNL1 TaxID=2711231 RepID=UPI0013E18EF1|nr:sulfatase [Roseimicrobium sp. ORNL1]QIF02682.1 sulfatase [Roseimicrobium sp. ORNL1]